MKFKDHDESVAFQFWQKSKATARADLALARFDSVNIKEAREALLLSTCEVAKRLNMSAQGYRQFEERAARDEATVAKLKAAATVLGCECILVIRPLAGETFAENLWKPLIARVYRAPWIQQSRRPNQRLLTLIAAANEFSQEAKFKKSQGWTRRRV